MLCYQTIQFFYMSGFLHVKMGEWPFNIVGLVVLLALVAVREPVVKKNISYYISKDP